MSCVTELVCENNWVKCSVEWCERTKVVARGMCDAHYRQARRGKIQPGPIRRLSSFPTHSVAHSRCRLQWGPARLYPCVKCHGQAQDWAYDGLDPNQMIERTGQKAGQIYSAWPEFYMPLCRLCHKRMDAAKAKAELLEYRLWKFDTGLTLEEVSDHRLSDSA